MSAPIIIEPYIPVAQYAGSRDAIRKSLEDPSKSGRGTVVSVADRGAVGKACDLSGRA
jgi:hypothetical protein